MSGKLRSVSTAFWSDPFVEELKPQHKLLFLYLMTNDKTNMLGIYESSVIRISFETGLPEEVISEGIKVFEKNKKLKYIDDYFILLNYIKHQRFNKNMKKAALKAYNDLPIAIRDGISKPTVEEKD